MHTRDQIKLSVGEWIALVLVTIGALNWGLVGLSGFLGGNLNVVNMIFGAFPGLESLVYLVVGLAGIYMVVIGYQMYGARIRRTSTAGEPEPSAK